MNPLDRDDARAIIESLLFTSGSPLSLEKLRRLLPESPKGWIPEILGELTRHYDKQNSGIRLVKIAGGYQLRTPAHLAPWAARLKQTPAPKLSKAALETLAVIAYRQPIIRSEVEYLRGVDSGGTIRTLLDLRLIRVSGRKEIPGRPLIYVTSRQFLELFGLESLDALPSPEELGALDVPEQTPDHSKAMDSEEPSP